MLVQLDTSQGVDWNNKGISRRLQNINNGLNTYRYEVAYDRTAGRNPANLDKPLDKFIEAIVAETYELVPTIDPKAKVLDVIPYSSSEGDVNLKVVIDLE